MVRARSVACALSLVVLVVACGDDAPAPTAGGTAGSAQGGSAGAAQGGGSAGTSAQGGSAGTSTQGGSAGTSPQGGSAGSATASGWSANKKVGRLDEDLLRAFSGGTNELFATYCGADGEVLLRGPALETSIAVGKACLDAAVALSDGTVIGATGGNPLVALAPGATAFTEITSDFTGGEYAGLFADASGKGAGVLWLGSADQNLYLSTSADGKTWSPKQTFAAKADLPAILLTSTGSVRSLADGTVVFVVTSVDDQLLILRRSPTGVVTKVSKKLAGFLGGTAILPSGDVVFTENPKFKQMLATVVPLTATAIPDSENLAPSYPEVFYGTLMPDGEGGVVAVYATSTTTVAESLVTRRYAGGEWQGAKNLESTKGDRIAGLAVGATTGRAALLAIDANGPVRVYEYTGAGGFSAPVELGKVAGADHANGALALAPNGKSIALWATGPVGPPELDLFASFGSP